MKKFFNIAGPCRAELHYMIDPLQRLEGVQSLIEGQHYFALHAPRQTGKTTYIYALMQQLNKQGRYTALVVNIQTAADARDSREAMRMVAAAIYRQATAYLLEPECPARVTENDTNFDNLPDYLSDWARHNRRPIVLFVDEVDALHEEFLLVLLRQLRAGFEMRPRGFPQSIILVGLRDVQEYKFHRPDHRSSFNNSASPFNVKSVSLLMPDFSFTELELLLGQHSHDTAQLFSNEVKQTIFQLTQGQPWLVNALVNHILTNKLHDDTKQPISLEHVIQAKNELLQHRDVHLHDLVSRLHEPPIKLVVESIINGEAPDFTQLDDALAYARSLGLVARHPPIQFSNPIYQELALRALSSAFQESLANDLVDISKYCNDQQQLNVDEMLTAFQRFYRGYAEIWLSRYDFKEAGRQLMFFAFLFRIIENKAEIYWDMSVGSTRCNLCVDYGEQRIAITLKLRQDNFARDEGLEQAARYAENKGLKNSFLILFDVFWEERIYREVVTIGNIKITLLGM
ncbi:MAG: hypothetical protein RIT27_2406 [Pseudomonadota bacterium]|jgi:type II secretory pathway predicted ATPase ExeA